MNSTGVVQNSRFSAFSARVNYESIVGLFAIKYRIN